MIISVARHAIHQYSKNILNKHPDELDDKKKEEIKNKIVKAVIEPEDIYHGKEDMSQVHIKNRIAIPVGVDKGDGLKPYSNLMQDLTVPTVYKAEVFRSKMDDKDERAAA